VLRFATAADAPRIAALIESAYRGEESRRGWTTEAHLIEGDRTSVAEIEAFIAAPQTHFLITLVQDDIVGCALIRNDNGIGYFGMFAVRPTLQGGGIGRGIMHFAENHIRKLWACTKVEMTVINLREDLIAYYERHGYKRAGTRPFPFDRESGAKRKDFHFVVLTKDLG
jgi:ribosomal protein S18 acetylase RimI-like enzyme